MKKVISLILLAFSFALYAQEAATSSESVSSSESSEITFKKDSLTSAENPPLVIHRGGIFHVFDYKMLDGKNLSYGELNKLLKTVPENKSLLVKKNIWQGLDYAFIAGFCAALGVTMYADNKGWSDMTYYSSAAGVGCFLFATCSGMIAHSYRSAAVDNYNLSVMGIPLN